MEFAQRYRARFLAAFVRGHLADRLPEDPRFTAALADLSDEEMESLFALAKEQELSLHKFKIKGDLPRVSRVMGLLRGLQFGKLLDIGTGRGVFLWPFMEAFPWVEVQCFDILEHRVADLQAMTRGGLDRLEASLTDLTDSGLPDGQFDVVTLLETLEHIPNAEKALSEACRLARVAVVLSVPSKPDDNPEHIHLFTPKRLTEMFAAAGVDRVRFHSVTNHIVALALKNP